MTHARPWPARIKWVVILLVIVVVYVATARIGLALALPPEKKASAFWMPSGLALAAILLGGYRAWPGVWLGAFIANAWDAFAPGHSASLFGNLAAAGGIAVGSTLQPLAGAWMLQRWVGRDGLFDGARSTFKFAGIAALACLVASTIGVTTLVVAGLAPWPKFWFTWWTWWLGDTAGIFVVTPLVLSWAEPRWPVWNLRRAGEAAVLATLLLAITSFVFGEWEAGGIVSGILTNLIIPLLLWAAFRFGQRGATAGIAVVSVTAVWGTALGNGPFLQPTLNNSLLLLQSFVAVLTITTLAIAGVLSERRRAQQARLDALLQLERALQEIKTLRGLIPICAWCKKIRNDAGSWEQLEAYLRQHTEARFSHGICPDCMETRHGLVEPDGGPVS